MSKQFFGTDGIRGEVGNTVTADFMLKLGWAVGRYSQRLAVKRMF